MSDEWHAAKKLRALVCADAPAIETSPLTDFNIVVSAQTPGQRSRVADLDLVVLGTWDRPYVRSFRIPALNQYADCSVALQSIALVIEVKGHDGSGIRLRNGRLQVAYREGWHDVTAQSMRQKEALRDYLRYNVGTVPFIVNLIWLTGIADADLDQKQLPQPNNILTSDITFSQLLEKMYCMNLPHPSTERGYVYNAFRWNDALPAALEALTKRLDFTTLDRRRLEEICRQRLELRWVQQIGSREIVFRGGAGAGKTIALLRSAYHAYKMGQRALILTYNIALVADMRRQMAILRINDDVASESIRVQTVHSFFVSLIEILMEIELLPRDSSWFDNDYKRTLHELRAYLKEGALTPEEVQEKIRDHGDALDWNVLCIDEGQDWLEEERDILEVVFGTERLLVADGRSQLVRRTGRCEWVHGNEGTVQIIEMRSCLRMKSSLIRFVNRVAERLYLPEWKLEDHGAVPGGRIYLTEQPLINRVMQDRLIAENSAAGNRPIDMLYCVGPGAVETSSDGERGSELATNLRSWGYQVWDAVDREERLIYPISVDQCRIVQYDSSRGLEGWIVILNGLDRFFEHKVRIAERMRSADKFLSDDSSFQELHAALWTLIPLTRAIDTLVITLSSRESQVSKAIIDTGDAMSDSVTWFT